MSDIVYVYRPNTPGDRLYGVPMRDLTQADLVNGRVSLEREVTT